MSFCSIYVNMCVQLHSTEEDGATSNNEDKTEF